MFQLGVALRMRAETPLARADDFQRALDAWRTALLARPSQSIWRRRIQCFGPVLDKPFAFYTWIEEVDDGRLAVPLTVSERLPRSTRIPGSRPSSTPQVLLDDTRSLPVDKGEFVRVETAVALNTAAAGGKVRIPIGAARVHVTLRPREGVEWAETAPDGLAARPPVLMLKLPSGWQADSRRIDFPRDIPERSAAEALRRQEFEISTVPQGLAPPPGDGASGGSEGGQNEIHEREGSDVKDDGPPQRALPPTRLSAWLVYTVLPPGADAAVTVRQDIEIKVNLSVADEPERQGEDPTGKDQ